MTSQNVKKIKKKIKSKKKKKKKEFNSKIFRAERVLSPKIYRQDWVPAGLCTEVVVVQA